MSTNGHVSHLSADDINRIMDEWAEITHEVRNQLHGGILKDSHDREECELDILLTTIIPACFSFGYGAEPTDLDDTLRYMWDCPRFAQIIQKRASIAGKTTKLFIKHAFSPRFTDRPDDTPIEGLKRKLLFRDGREMMLEAVLGKDEIRRILNEKIFSDGIRKVSKRHKPDRSDDPEKKKSARQPTVTNS